MTTTDAAAARDLIQIEVLVPAPIPREERPRFENAMVDFLFGSDHIRPELRDDLAAAGVDFNRLSELAEPTRLGLCPTPGALEFVPGEELVEVCERHGLDLTAGGSVVVSFDYDAYEGRLGPDDRLEIRLGLPEAVIRDAAGSTDVTADIVRALFGDCQLPEPVRAYLRVHGVDIQAVAVRNADRLGGEGKPFTSRVSPRVHGYLTEKGFNLDEFGRFEVTSIDRVGDRTLPDGPGAAWEKTTCC